MKLKMTGEQLRKVKMTIDAAISNKQHEREAFHKAFPALRCALNTLPETHMIAECPTIIRRMIVSVLDQVGVELPAELVQLGWKDL